MELHRRRKDIGALVIHIVLVCGVILVAMPFLWMILSSLKSLKEFYTFRFFPRILDLSAYQYIFGQTMFLRWYLNSFIVAIVVTASNLIFASLVGFVLAKYRFPGSRATFILILSTFMIPTEMLVIPWYVMSAKLHWVNSFWGIMFPGMLEAFSVFLMRQFMFGVPDDLLNAARIDGMRELCIWWSVAMPQVRPALSALGIITFLGNWNAYLWPVIVINTEKMRTLPVGVALYSTADNGGGTQWNIVMAMSTLAVIPIIIVFLIFQKRIIEGVTLTGVKG
jgi:multiple sugar transport system permease protein